MACGTPEPATGSAFDGAWRVVSVATGAESETTQTEPSIVLFSEGFYSWAQATAARQLFRAEAPTDSERLPAYASVVFNSGTFETSDSALILRPIVARNPNYMTGGSETYRYQLSADTLSLTISPRDLRFRLGDEVVSSSATSEQRFRLVRFK